MQQQGRIWASWVTHGLQAAQLCNEKGYRGPEAAGSLKEERNKQEFLWLVSSVLNWSSSYCTHLGWQTEKIQVGNPYATGTRYKPTVDLHRSGESYQEAFPSLQKSLTSAWPRFPPWSTICLPQPPCPPQAPRNWSENFVTSSSERALLKSGLQLDQFCLHVFSFPVFSTRISCYIQ